MFESLTPAAHSCLTLGFTLGDLGMLFVLSLLFLQSMAAAAYSVACKPVFTLGLLC